MMSFNMNFAMPYMTYQMTPMMMASPMMMGSTGFAGAGMMGGMFGMPMAAPVGSLNLGLGMGGGLQMNLGGSGLAAALGLTGASNSGMSALDMQLLRTLLGRGAGLDSNGSASLAAAESGAEAQMRRLNASIADVTTRINNQLGNLQQMREDTNQNSFALEKVGERLLKLEQRLDALQNTGEKKNGSE
jgi:hypothetical protein